MLCRVYTIIIIISTYYNNKCIFAPISQILSDIVLTNVSGFPRFAIKYGRNVIIRFSTAGRTIKSVDW